MPPTLARSQSKNVNGYVKAERRRRALAAKLAAKELALEPLRRQVLLAQAAARLKYSRLTGGQLAEASRLLEAPVQS